MPKQLIEVDLNEFAGGALREKFEQAYTEVVANLYDPNMLAKGKRKLTLELTFEVVEKNKVRGMAFIDIDTKTKLNRPMKTSTQILIGADGKGNVLASEYKNQVPGQMVTKVNNETGELTPAEDVVIENNIPNTKKFRLVE